MARTDNLNDYLTDLANSIRTKKGYSSSQKIAANDFDTEIASITTVFNQDKTVSPSTSSQAVEADQGYTGLGTVTVNPVTSSIDANITQANIRAGVSILGVTGNLEPDKPDQTKTANPSTSSQVIEPDSGYELASVTINPVTSSIDANITAGNIKKDVTILGITGTLEEGIDTSDATAVADDIVEGKTAYVNGVKITGTKEDLSSTITAQENLITQLQLALRNKTGANSEYIKLAYVENTGNIGKQWIDTGLNMTQITKIEIDGNYTVIDELERDQARVAMANTSSSAWQFILQYTFNSDNEYKFRMQSGGGGKQILFGTADTNRHKFIFDKSNQKYWVDNNSYNFQHTEYNLGTFIMFGKRNNGNASNGDAKFRLYSLKFYNGNTLLKDFIPVKRIRDNEICLYDLVNEVFAINEGESPLIAGPEID